MNNEQHEYYVKHLKHNKIGTNFGLDVSYGIFRHFHERKIDNDCKILFNRFQIEKQFFMLKFRAFVYRKNNSLKPFIMFE